MDFGEMALLMEPKIHKYQDGSVNSHTGIIKMVLKNSYKKYLIVPNFMGYFINTYASSSFNILMSFSV
jgi:hypothetical protein